MNMRIIMAAMGLLLLAAAPFQGGEVKAGVDAWADGDFKKAVDLWRPPAVGGDADAQFNMGQAYKLGRGVPVDLTMAEEWYRRAAVQGHPQAQDNYGLALFQNGKITQSVEWLEKSAARGEPRAQFVLGTVLFNGDVGAKDWVRAYALITRANAAGLPQAAQTLVQMDRYIGTRERQEGLTLARRYESEAGRAPATALAASEPARPLPQTPPAKAPRATPAAPPKAVAATPPKAAPRPAASRTDGGWRVQLGAFRDAGNARSLWGAVSRNAALSGTGPSYVKAGAVTRVLVGPFGSAADANQACAALKRDGQPCIPVRG